MVGKAPPRQRPGGEGERATGGVDLNIPNPAMKEFDAGRKLLQEKHDVPGSIGHFRKATQLYSGFTQAYVILGLAYLQDQKLKESQAALEQARQPDPKSHDQYLNVGPYPKPPNVHSRAPKHL